MRAIGRIADYPYGILRKETVIGSGVNVQAGMRIDVGGADLRVDSVKLKPPSELEMNLSFSSGFVSRRDLFAAGFVVTHVMENSGGYRKLEKPIATYEEYLKAMPYKSFSSAGGGE